VGLSSKRNSRRRRLGIPGRLWIAVLALLVSGCGAEPRFEPRPTETLRLPQRVAEERVTPSEGNCAPAGHPDTSFSSCCNRSACSGYCVLNTRTQMVSCQCFGRDGSCPAGTICCKVKGGCATPEECFKASKSPER